MRREVFINGVSCSFPGGATLEAFWNELLAPDSPERMQKNTDHSWRGEGKEATLCKRAAQCIKSAAEEAGISLKKPEGICIVLGSGMGLSDLAGEGPDGNKILSRIKPIIQAELGVCASMMVIANACGASSQAIGFGYDLVRTGAYKHVIAGGMEGYSEITTMGFSRLNNIDPGGCKPFDAHRKGIQIGCGTAFFALGAKPLPQAYARLLGYGTSNDAYHIVAPDHSGQYIEAAIAGALSGAGLKPQAVDAVVAHGTGTKLNDLIEARALNRLFGEIDTTAPKGKIGHTGGACGAFGLLTAICMLRHQTIPPIAHLMQIDKEIQVHPIMGEAKKKTMNAVLSSTLAFGGTNTALLCGRV